MFRPFLVAATAVLAVFIPPSAGAAAPARGYQARSCGFDLNRNGVVGEPADCTICGTSDGNLTVSGSTYTQIYVDCANGNNANTGTRAQPLRTVTAALSRSPAAGASLAVCIRGTCSAESWPLSPPPGLAGSYTRSTSPSETGVFAFPTKPTIVSGWDVNGDGSYPPASGETAILDGNTTAQSTLNAPSNFEMAHITVQRFANTTAAQDQYTTLVQPQDGVTLAYFHDTIWQQTHQATASGIGSGEQIIFSLYNSTGWRNSAWINNVIRDYSAHIWRGSTTNPAGPIRIQNTTVRGKPTVPNGTPFMFKSWGLYTGIELLDNDADAQPSLWLVGRPNQGVYALGFTPCTQNVVIRNNKFSNYQIVAAIQPDAGSSYCRSRPVTDVTFDANEMLNSWPWDCYGGVAIQMDSSDAEAVYVGTVTITNNIIHSAGTTTGGYQAGILMNPTRPGTCSDLPGGITIAGNTFDFAPRRYCGGDQGPFGFIAVTGFDGVLKSCRQQTFSIVNNIFSNQRTQDSNGMLIWTSYAPTQWVADNNVFNETAVPARWSWNNGSQTSLAQWRTATGTDARSRDCAPAFANRSGGDFHLTASDSCARDQGTPVAGLVLDLDRDTRPQGTAWDIGADEFAVTGSGPSAPPSAPRLFDVTPLP